MLSNIHDIESLSYPNSRFDVIFLEKQILWILAKKKQMKVNRLQNVRQNVTFEGIIDIRVKHQT